MTAPGQEEFMTVQEVADLLKLNPQTVRNLIDSGELPAIRIGRRVRIQRSVLERQIGWQQDERVEVGAGSAPRTLTSVVDDDAVAVALEELADCAQKLAAAIREATMAT